MAVRIILGQDYEMSKEGQEIIVANWKLEEMKKDKIKFVTRLASVTGVRKIEFEQKVKPKKKVIKDDSK